MTERHARPRKARRRSSDPPEPPDRRAATSPTPSGQGRTSGRMLIGLVGMVVIGWLMAQRVPGLRLLPRVVLRQQDPDRRSSHWSRASAAPYAPLLLPQHVRRGAAGSGCRAALMPYAFLLPAVAADHADAALPDDPDDQLLVRQLRQHRVRRARELPGHLRIAASSATGDLQQHPVADRSCPPSRWSSASIVAVLADKLSPSGEKISKASSSCRWRSRSSAPPRSGG